MQTKQTKIPNTPLAFLRFVTKRHAVWAILAIASAALAALLSQGSNVFFKLITDAVENGNKQQALWYGLAYPLVILLIQATYRLSGWMGMYWITGTQKETSDILFNYLTKHSHGYFVDRFAGSLLSKIGNVIGAIDSLISSFLWSHLNAFVSLVATFVFLFFVDIMSALLFALLVVVLLILNYRWMDTKRILSKETALAGTVLRGAVVDVLGNIAAMRQFTRISEEQGRQADLSTHWIKKRRTNWMFTERTLLYNSLILALFSIGIFYIMTMRWQADAITTGDFLFVLAMMSSLSGTLIFIGRAMTDTARAFGEAEEGLEEILLPYEIIDTENSTELQAKAGEVSWDKVTFNFGNNAVFQDFSLTIPPGQTVGLVGHSGAGKTTFVSLLLRQHDVDGGAIKIDGQDISTVTQDSLRAAISVVPQEPALFHRSIRENIAYGKPDATDEEIIAVAKKAHAHDFIVTLSEGYDTMVGERGVKLSGGQKQRVAIARAMLKNAPILVLDEATSALDSESEVAIQKALKELMEDKTVIAVAHRLSTLREMDRIIVLEAGKVVEDGTHAELVQKKNGIYKSLWEHQAGGFVGE